MAGDWIPMRLELINDPAVIQIAEAVGVDEYGVIGRLYRLWSWANAHLVDGLARSVPSQWVDRYLATPGFAAAMLAAGWLRARSDGIEFPHFDRWNSRGAKSRLQAARRVQDHRCNARTVTASVTEPLPEKRREEKRRDTKDTPPPPEGGEEKPAKKGKPQKGPPFDPLAVELPFPSPEFKAAWADWVAYRREKKADLTPTSVRQQLKFLAPLGDAGGVACIEQSIRCTWTGLFPIGTRGVPPPPPKKFTPARSGKSAAAGLDTPAFTQEPA